MLYSNNAIIDRMSYKYPFMGKLAKWIRDGKIPEDLDMEEVISFWMKNHNDFVSKKYEPWKNKPRFYNRALTANSRAKKLGSSGKITHNDLEDIFQLYGGKCKTCQGTNNLVFDHIKPFYRGGTNTVDNLQVLCRLCNMEKGVKE